nr:ORF6C domain-containing protein [uncultured Blautia sp.]
MNEVKIFENAELDLQVRTILNPDGSISVSAEDTAIGFGWTKTEKKNGKEYTSVRWERMSGFSAECGFDHSWSKDDYIPESLFYLLGMKANNERAQKYQRWLAMEVIPSLRKTGTYRMESPKSSLQLLELELAALKEVDGKVDAVNKDLQEFKKDLPILGVEEGQITNAVKRKGVNCLGGKNSNAYKDRPLRTKLYCDIHRELKRQFGVTTYKAIKRSQCETAIKIIEEYEPPLYLKEQISYLNAQENLEVA